MAIRICWNVSTSSFVGRQNSLLLPVTVYQNALLPLSRALLKSCPIECLIYIFWTINSLSSSVRRYSWNTGHGGSLSIVRTGGSRMTPNQCCTAGEESPSIPASQASHPPWPKDVWIRELSWRMVMSLMSMSGRLFRMSLFSFVRSWVNRSHSAGWPRSKSPQAGCHPDPKR